MAPFASADSYDVLYDSLDTAAQYESSVLANDMDMESDPLTAVLVGDVAHGTLTGLDHDTSDRLIEVTAPDPDGAGPLTAPAITYAYDGTSSRLASITDPLSQTTDIDYDFAGRFDEATYADASTLSYDAFQTRGLVDTSTGKGAENDPADLFLPDDPFMTNAALLTDMMQQDTLIETDRFGYVIAWKNPLGQPTRP